MTKPEDESNIRNDDAQIYTKIYSQFLCRINMELPVFAN